MNVASLELCKELYEVSGWVYDAGFNGLWYDGDNLVMATWIEDRVPAYDLGYLLRKLPNMVGKAWLNLAPETSYEGLWIADYQGDGSTIIESATSPEDAACKLAIELFRQKILDSSTDSV